MFLEIYFNKYFACTARPETHELNNMVQGGFSRRTAIFLKMVKKWSFWPILTPLGGTPKKGSKMAFFQGTSPYSCINLEGEAKFDVSLIRGGTPGRGVPPQFYPPHPSPPTIILSYSLCDEKTHPYAFIEILETD